MSEPLYWFSVSDYEESHAVSFYWNHSENRPTSEQFESILLKIAVDMYKEGNHVIYGNPGKVDSFQQFLRYEFEGICDRIVSMTHFKIHCPEYYASVMWSGCDENAIMKLFDGHELQIPEICGKDEF